MEYGVQRRNIYLIPPNDEALRWFFAQFDVPEVYEMFGFGRPARMHIMRAHRLNRLVVGMLHRLPSRKRIGFVVMFEPGDEDFWEFGYAIPDTADRDAFSALTATDLMGHYMFDHLRVHRMGWRNRADNRAAEAVVRRLGYKSFKEEFENGHKYIFYDIDPEGWAKRKRRLEAGEARHPSGLGSALVTLLDPPFDPVEPVFEEDP